MEPVSGFSIKLVDQSEFDELLVYLNDHLSENGKGGLGYFQPRERGNAAYSSEGTAAFRNGLIIPVGEAGWRRAWVARSTSGSIAGHVDLRSHPEGLAEHRCLLGMGVDRNHRKLGLGARLFEHAEQWALANSALEWIDLRVLSANATAIRLYLRSGFTKVGEVPDMFRVDGHSLSYTSMTKRLGAKDAPDA